MARNSLSRPSTPGNRYNYHVASPISEPGPLFGHSVVDVSQYALRPESPSFIMPLGEMTPRLDYAFDTHFSGLQPGSDFYGQFQSGFDLPEDAHDFSRVSCPLQLNPEASEFTPRVTDLFCGNSSNFASALDELEGLRNTPSRELAMDHNTTGYVMPGPFDFNVPHYATPPSSQTSDFAGVSLISLDTGDVSYGIDGEHGNSIYPSIEPIHGDNHKPVNESDGDLNFADYPQAEPMGAITYLPTPQQVTKSPATTSLDIDGNARYDSSLDAEYDDEDDDQTPGLTGYDSGFASADVTRIGVTQRATVITTEQDITLKLKQGLAVFKEHEGTQITPGPDGVFWTAPPRDNTIPDSQEAKDIYHEQLIVAIYNNTGCIETETSKSYQNRWGDDAKFYTRCEIEAAALEILSLAIEIHQIGWTKPIFDGHMREEIYKTMFFSFQERFDALISLLTISKNTCEALMKCERLHAVVGNPWLLDKRVRSNKASNGKKASRIAFATAVEKEEKVAGWCEAPEVGNGRSKANGMKRVREDDDTGELSAAQVAVRPTKRPRRSTRTKI
ncbi:hypothetical protein P153DRAFT_132328 [Dothidotthia symphoricarpi CBS 119687]|uniref:Uncharacterized protein n=1 Tax=Dothidotthia symphoricarpi CBS 119687 TaxID=1392245 RepID=A0A6A5ZYU3_9PLEO|nr:uncharacterized protein P153DRAFT_132328 [Dothidotthia symphoricarpi CBS 119687]KAF2124456.1 hypothetical protein P153DRAFT_132328 [Dothidotthia symphoricarpi CBS 119687]